MRLVWWMSRLALMKTLIALRTEEENEALQTNGIMGRLYARLAMQYPCLTSRPRT